MTDEDVRNLFALVRNVLASDNSEAGKIRNFSEIVSAIEGAERERCARVAESLCTATTIVTGRCETARDGIEAAKVSVAAAIRRGEGGGNVEP